MKKRENKPNRPTKPVVINMLGLPSQEVVEGFDEAKLRKEERGNGKKRKGGQ